MEQLKTHFNFNDANIALTNLLFNPWFYIGASMVLSFLMVSKIPLFALKFKSIKSKQNIIRIVFILLSLWLLITYEYLGIPLIIVTYILLSLIDILVKKLFNYSKPDPHEI